ncbi:MAG: metallophosphoesterase family protein [Desulfovibrio sp.]|jgi:Icc-related predicted phosphoesterase|nr:metallophosphoesterase family protein [Desulfovibrio sp.]
MRDTPFFLAFGDVHNDIGRFAALEEIAAAEGVIVSGDITFAGGVEDALRVLLPLAGMNPNILAQIGNMDKGAVTGMLEEKGWNLHRSARRLFPGVYALGLGASTPTPFRTPSEYPEEVMAGWLDEAYRRGMELFAAERAEIRADPACAGREEGGPAARPADEPVFVLVSHCPPYGTACDRLGNGHPAGSRAVRGFIEERQPDLCVCGHIHEARAEDFLGRTRVINPGPLSGGGCVLIYSDKDEEGRLRAEMKHVHNAG